MAELAKVGVFCPNPACSDYEELDGGIIKHGRTRAGVQRFKCLTCGKTFTETRGTIFYRRRTADAEILECLSLLAEGSRISSVSRVKGHKADTVAAWLLEAAKKTEIIENVLLAGFRVSRGQLDGLWSYVKNKGEKKGHVETKESGQFFRSTMMDMDSRLRAGRGFGKTETSSSAAVFRLLKERGHSDGPPPTVSDGWGGIREAMLEIFGKVPEYSGKGRPPSKKRPQPGWKYLQIVKQRDENGNFLGTWRKAVHGSMDELDKIFGKSTAYIERSHLTMRTFSSRLTRKGIAFSKSIDMHKAAAALEDIYYNFIKPLKTLRLKAEEKSALKWLPRTPAMAAGLSDHVWTLKEVFSMVVIDNNT